MLGLFPRRTAGKEAEDLTEPGVRPRNPESRPRGTYGSGSPVQGAGGDFTGKDHLHPDPWPEMALEGRPGERRLTTCSLEKRVRQGQARDGAGIVVMPTSVISCTGPRCRGGGVDFHENRMSVTSRSRWHFLGYETCKGSPAWPLGRGAHHSNSRPYGVCWAPIHLPAAPCGVLDPNLPLPEP